MNTFIRCNTKYNNKEDNNSYNNQHNFPHRHKFGIVKKNCQYQKIKVDGDDSNYDNYCGFERFVFDKEDKKRDIIAIMTHLSPHEEAISKKIAYVLIHAITSNRKTSVKEKFFKNVNQLDFYREINALDSFCMIIALQKHYGRSDTGINIAKEVNSFATEAMLEMGIFQTYKELSAFMKKRFNDYELAYENNKEPGALWWIAKQFCIFNEIELEPAPIVFISQYFISIVKANMEIIKDIAK